MNQVPLTNLRTQYVPRDDSGQLQVCVRMPRQAWIGGLASQCIPSTPDVPSGMTQYLPSECAAVCHGSSGQWTHISSNKCIQNPNAVPSDGPLFANEHDCLNYPQAYYLS